jgi:hypothetical protein
MSDYYTPPMEKLIQAEERIQQLEGCLKSILNDRLWIKPDTHEDALQLIKGWKALCEMHLGKKNE